MPEGDTIFRAARTLQKALAGRVITQWKSGYAQLTAVDDQAPIVGRSIERVWSVGKHLFMALSGDLVLRTHMRMNGAWHLYRPGESWRRAASAARIVIGTDAFVAVAFDVPVAEFQTAQRQAQTVARLGPDLLAAEFDADRARARLRSAGDLDLAAALLDQRLVAGIGNVVKSEVLFMEGLHPRRLVSSVSDAQLEALLARARILLQRSTESGTRNTTGSWQPDAALWVYGRAGEKCRRCAAVIDFYKQGDGARSTYFCPRCQPLQ